MSCQWELSTTVGVPIPPGQERGWEACEAEVDLEGRARVAKNGAVKSERRCDGRGLVWNENWNDKGNNVEEGSFSDI